MIMRILQLGTRRIVQTGLVLILAGLVMLPVACGNQKESRQEVPTRDINAVMTDHTSQLMAIPGVQGVAIGELEDHTPCILVLVVEETDEIDRKVPKVLEGHPVRLMVSGVIRPMKGQ
jgi:hypothetical protein